MRQIVSRSRGTARIELARTRRLFGKYLHHEHPRIAAERKLAGEQLEEDHAEAVNIASAVGLVAFAARLLGGHVRRSAEHAAVDRERELAGVALGQAKIHDVRLAFEIDHHVARLEIAMDDALLVGIVQGAGDLSAKLGGLARGEALGREPVSERDAADKVADDVDRVLGASDFVNAHDVGVAKLRGDAGLAIELLGFCGSELALARDLDGDGAIELVVVRLPDRAESADANLFDEIEVGDRSNGVSDFGFVDRADKAERAAAGAANDVLDIHFPVGLDGVVAMRATNVK